MKFYSILEGQTQDVLRRLLRLINKSIGRISDAEEELEDINTLIGDPSNPGEGTILKSVADINTAIGDEDTADTILYRIKALEDAANGGTETTPGEGG